MRKLAAVLGALALLSTASAAMAAKQVHNAVPIAPNGRVSIETHNGTVTVTTWNQPTVDVSARIEPAPLSSYPEDADKADVRVVGGGANVSIISDYDRVPEHSMFLGFGSERVFPLIHYTIRVPATAEVRIKAHNARAMVTGLRNDVAISTHNGNVIVNDLDGAADIDTHNGDIAVDFVRYAKASRIETHNGDVRVTMPPGSRFELRTDTHHGSVSSDFASAGGGPALRFVAHNGSLHVKKR